MRLKIYHDVMPAIVERSPAPLCPFRRTLRSPVQTFHNLPPDLFIRIQPSRGFPVSPKSYDILRIKVRSNGRNVAPDRPLFLPFIPNSSQTIHTFPDSLHPDSPGAVSGYSHTSGMDKYRRNGSFFPVKVDGRTTRAGGMPAEIDADHG
jgi:hypothetical protein